MEYDIADAPEAILAALKNNTAFPESLSRRFSLAQGYDVQFELLKRRIAKHDRVRAVFSGLGVVEIDFGQ